MPKPKESFESQLQRVLVVPEARARVRQLVEDELFVIDGAASKGKVRKINGRGPKAKGRAGCEAVQKLLLAHIPGLTENDIFIKATSMGGADLHLSDVALEQLNFAIEVKNSESLNVFKALKQAELNGAKVKRPYIVFFKRANSEIFAALPAAQFLLLLAFTKGVDGQN